MKNLTHFRTCNLCEAMCGLEITVTDGVVSKIEGDKNDSFSRGHICPKAVALKDIYEDPNRLKYPVKRTPEGWQQISWEEAFEEVIEKIKQIQAKCGNNAVAMYQGNPSIHNLGTTMNSPLFAKSLRTKNMFSATSADQLPHHFAAWQMFGHPMLMPIPDIDFTDFMLIIGGNPIASNGSIMSVPDVANRLKAIQKRGGKVVVVDPRFTETAAKADQHFFIRPGADALLLLAMIHIIFAENLVKLEHLAEFTDNIDLLREISSDFTPERVERQTGISAENIRQLTLDFTQAKTAVCYGRVGVSVQTFGSIAQWLINAINLLTGNLDKIGGAMFTAPAVDFLARAKTDNRFNRWQSRVRKLPEFLGELPVATLSEEILTEGEGQIKCLITSCGNPVLSTPNGGKLDEALESLEFMVAIDIYINETTRHADIILPPATGLEVPHYDMTFHVLAVRNTAKFSEALFSKAKGAKYDWEIYQELAYRMAHHTSSNEGFMAEPPEQKLDLGLQFGPYGLSLEKLRANPHGIDLGPLKSCLPNRLLTENKRINAAPAILVKDIERLSQQLLQTGSGEGFDFTLIGRRHLRDNNSWMHNSERLVKGRNRCTLMIHTEDAKRLNIENQAIVKVSSRVGSVEIPVEITDQMMRGVVSMPHGYGHARKGVKLDVAEKYAGVSINDLTDELVIDELTGNAAFNNVNVRIEKI
ncbi:molybdopterin dinucleotide-binding region [Emticicia oligotrophica DSM 17448]|uniref:Molybdopterin dinucleotide-binding region n=1 Tax=Emticicia oligotrophica (strain DSM 17448 / CIP 109782 / MTCC 6937 / GPTSA100-15) TaxID=929562 RepID=A0ABN4AMG1_EMTOG|nr:molybdopterin oxidoreductase family protein [Emticicia oligotrophica]AFK03344.1 molybdopterin dinucleotide-binding region [Emticicia oligotrophica DSM 17448]